MADFPMSDKDSFQKAFTHTALRPETAVPDMLAASKQNLIEQRFNIYRNNIAAGLIGALEQSFPIVKRLVGAIFFQALAHEFFKDNLPSSPVMLDYGRQFPDFLAQFEPVAELPFLPDIAKAEWLYIESFHSADAKAITMAELLQLGGGQLTEAVLQLHPSLRLIASDYAIFSLWNAHDPSIEDDAVRMPKIEQGEAVMFTRPSLQVSLYLIDITTIDFLKQIKKGYSLGMSAHKILQKQPQFNLEHSLVVLFESGAICGVCHEASRKK